MDKSSFHQDFQTKHSRGSCVHNSVADGLLSLKMKRQEQIRVVIVNTLRAGRTCGDIMWCHKIKLSTVYDMKTHLEVFVAAGGSTESFRIERKKHKRGS